MTEAFLLGAAVFTCGMLHLIWKQLEAAKQDRALKMEILHDKIAALSLEVYHISNTVEEIKGSPKA
jgi:hypothetical protein